VTSAINYAAINENFPVAGQDNDTQVFRDNFDTIKTNFLEAKSEIEDLQDNTARTDQDTDFNGNIITNAALQNVYDRTFEFSGLLMVPTTIDFENGNYQICRFGANVNIDFLNFPDDDTNPSGMGKVTLELYGDGTARTLTFVTAGGTVLKKSAGFPTPFTVSSSDNPVFVEVWRHKSDRIFLHYLGQFS
jgi:hypothetical protein